METSDLNLVLAGVAGSHAYGLNREGSDIDRPGVFVAPTLDVAGLDWTSHKETHHGTSAAADYTYHEVGKAIRLMLACNPTVLELLWMDDYDTAWIDGLTLISIRESFLWEKGVRNAYGGYARAQARKLANRDDFGAGMGNRTVKHGRHLLRLLRQGRQLLHTGTLTLRVDDPEEYWAFDDMSIDDMLAVYERENALFDATRSVLPPEPDRAAASRVLREIRRGNL